ncbi:MAG: adenylate/guanylate cyclase domain-containing protein [Micavibrio aeruginosavorus]|nr:adenylate/guanylate cyclase domain-containing protein [Micavibrio aeruginosavorus]
MQQKNFFSLRYKITIAFFVIGFVFSSVLGVVAYRILEAELFDELRQNVGNITRMGAELLDREALRALTAEQRPGLSAAEVDALERSRNYKIISDQLNFMRDTEKDLIRYVYLVVPTDDPGRARYLVDADVLALKAEGAADSEISHFSADMDTTPFPVLQRALREKTSAVEEEYVYDEAFKVNTVSGYAPVLSDDGKTLLALLGLDMADSEVRAALSEVTRQSLFAASLSLLVSLLTAIAMGTWFTRGIIRLDHLVRSFAEKDFAVRAQIHSNDEVGRLGFSFNHMAETIQGYSDRLEALVGAYGRFVPHDLLRLLEKKSILDVNLGDQIQRDMAVLFSDMRDFTTISESMSPKENFDYINSYLRQVGPEIRAHNGVIDKYIGDAVMALFPESVDDAIEAALEMQRKVRAYNGKRAGSSYPDVRIGVGIHAGKVMLGTIGEDQRMDGTVISDTVNLASRLEGLTKRYGCNIMVSDTVIGKMRNPKKYVTRLIDRVCVAGKNDSVTLFEVCDPDDANVWALKKATLADYNAAVDLYYAGDFSDSGAAFTRVLDAHPDDVPARLFLEKIQTLMANGVPSGWDGISRYDSKH